MGGKRGVHACKGVVGRGSSKRACGAVVDSLAVAEQEKVIKHLRGYDSYQTSYDVECSHAGGGGGWEEKRAGAPMGVFRKGRGNGGLRLHAAWNTDPRGWCIEATMVQPSAAKRRRAWTTFSD